jgi:hypothetical protein
LDATTVQITTKAYLAEISQWLDEAASIAKAAQACADAGNTKQGIAIALDVEQLVYEVNTLLNACLSDQSDFEGLTVSTLHLLCPASATRPPRGFGGGSARCCRNR